MKLHTVRVGPLPPWLRADVLLGPGVWRYEAGAEIWAVAELSPLAAADLAARVRGIGLGGQALQVDVRPALDRKTVRAARTDEARRHRDTSIGFTRPRTRTDDEGRWSLTPESLALTIGRQACATIGEPARVLDAGCGIGGNTIGFARAGAIVTAVDRDETRLGIARHNAAIYDVADRIQWIHEDVTSLVAKADVDLVFVDPPWGRDFDKRRTTLADLPLLQSLLQLDRLTPHLWAKVPPSFDPNTAPPAGISAVFGDEAGDNRRVKFLLLKW